MFVKIIYKIIINHKSRFCNIKKRVSILISVIFPYKQMPCFMQDIAKVITLTYAGDAMRIMLLNANVADLSTDLIILLAFGHHYNAYCITIIHKIK